MKPELLLDWLNTLSVDSCLLVSTLDDLKSGNNVVYTGVVLCEVYDHLCHSQQDDQFREIIKRRGTREDSVSNFQLLLSSFPENQRIQSLFEGKRLEEVYYKDSFLLEILKMLYKLRDNQPQVQNQVAKRKRSTSQPEKRGLSKKSQKSNEVAVEVDQNKNIYHLEPSQQSDDNDINPKLSLQDTPVSGMKIVKPGSRKSDASKLNYSSMGSHPIKELIMDQANIHQSLKFGADDRKDKQEVRFDGVAMFETFDSKEKMFRPLKIPTEEKALKSQNYGMDSNVNHSTTQISSMKNRDKS